VLDRVLSADRDCPAVLSAADIADLLRAEGADFHAVCATADALRKETCGNKVSFVVNRNINFTNVCVKRCRFCAFSRTAAKQSECYVLPLDEIVRRASEAADLGATEVCVQAGLLPNASPTLYTEIAAAIKAARPHLHLHAFSPEEVLYGASRGKSSVRDFLVSLREAGVDTLPGTSAEILGDDALRRRLAPGRLSTSDWVDVVRTAHAVGLRTTATMMYGHIETPEHVARHLQILREIQSDTAGFTEFVPLGFIASEAPGRLDGSIGADLREGPTGPEVLRTHAVARIVLHGSIDNIQASWVKEGVKMAQVLLNAGCNDLGGTLVNESISTSAGASFGQMLRPREMRKLIVSCRRVPYERLTDYRVKGAEDRASELDDVDVAQFGSYSQLVASPDFRFRRKPAARSTAPAMSPSNPGAPGMSRHMSSTAWARGCNDREDRVVTFSPSITVIPTYECFNSCTYCNFRTTATRSSAGWTPLATVRSQLERAPGGTVEVLVMSGEVHPGLVNIRAEWVQHVADICNLALDMGFMPHTNVGPLSEAEFAVLKPVNFSMGLMLEQVVALPVHRHAPSKHPSVRIEAIRAAGELGIPFTTGILCGIGETEKQRLESLEVLAGLQQKHGHLQECILQPHSTGSQQRETPSDWQSTFDLNDLPDLIRAARSILPDSVGIQVPPNLVASQKGLLRRCLDAGARDLGGISLVNKDEVNPDFVFPGVPGLARELAVSGYELRERPPVYPTFARRFLKGRLLESLMQHEDRFGFQRP